MKRQSPIENTNSDRDQVIRLLSESEHQTVVDADRLAANVLDRIRHRQRGLRRLIGGTTVLGLLLAAIVLTPILSDLVQPPNAIVELDSEVIETANSTEGNSADTESTDSTERLEDRLLILASEEKLMRLKQELERLNQIEHEQQMILARERLSRSLANRTIQTYPVFFGE